MFQAKFILTYIFGITNKVHPANEYLWS